MLSLSHENTITVQQQFRKQKKPVSLETGFIVMRENQLSFNFEWKLKRMICYLFSFGT
jgi:hypothetical protein